jgi:hypothetical protein
VSVTGELTSVVLENDIDTLKTEELEEKPARPD